MDVVFLKENVIKSKQNDKSGKNARKLLQIDKQNEFLFEKNISQFLDLVNFFTGRDDVLVYTGYALSGKTLLASTIKNIVTEQTICHFFKCTPASTLDDLLLTFFETFKEYAKKQLVKIPKIETQNFQERINFYLTKCENPIVITLDGLNEIENSKNKEEIMNFLSHIACIEKIKLVVTTRAFDISDLKNINLRLTTSVIKPLTQDDLKDYCLKNIINSEEIEEFHKLSRGHYQLLKLAMNYIQPTNLTIKELVNEVKESKKSIDEILISKNLSLISAQYLNLLWITTIAEFGMPKNNLVSMPDFEEEHITFLGKKGIIELYNDCIYVKNYFKPDILKTIEPLAQINIIKGIIKFLEAQLPLKPSARELKLSRMTIRNEIDRLNKIINKTQINKKDKNKSAYLNILGYSKQFKTNWDGFDNIIMPKKNSFKKLVEEDAKKSETEPSQKETEIVEGKKEDNSTLKLAQMLKYKYSYSEALIQYADALNEAIEQQNKKLIIEILKEIAECYFKLGDYPNAVENYGKAHELAKEENLTAECYDIMLQIAEIYKATYKKDLACEIYKDILSQDSLPELTTINAEINLFEANFSELTPKEILQKYYNLLEKTKNYKDISAKIHFKLGFLYDKASSTNEAESHYLKSIEICDDYKLNTNLSSCYYNLAEIYMERKEYDKALDNYLKSYTIDEITKNIDMLLITIRKIARLYERKKDDLALEYYEKELDYAKVLNDNYPLACAFIDLGDYYYRKKEDLKALRVYMSAQKTMANQLTQENELAIKDRINDLKVRMGKEIVENLIKEFY